MDSEAFSICLPVVFACLLAIGLIAYQVRMIESVKNELEETHNNFREVASHYDQCRSRVEELEVMLRKETDRKENLTNELLELNARYKQKCKRIEKLQSALKAISEMAEESSHL